MVYGKNSIRTFLIRFLPTKKKHVWRQSFHSYFAFETNDSELFDTIQNPKVLFQMEETNSLLKCT
ncbi:hypothetical protein B0192_22820 [Leptospira interrogans serovar Australis]|nr:hypothetical protein B0192_22820 [Leptospira interrogans serovar Australis]